MVTHFKTGGHLACGHKGNKLTSTTELNRVKCRSCRNTDAYKDARKDQRNAARRAARKAQAPSGQHCRQRLAALRQARRLRVHRRRAGVVRASPRRGARHVVVDVGATAHPAGQVAFDGELVDGGHHRVARQVQILGEFAAGGELVSGMELALQHCPAQGFIQLAVQRHLPFAAELVHFTEDEF